MNSLVEFLSNLRTLGVVLSVDGDRLICNAPKGAVTPEIKRQLTERKPEILAFLRDSAAPEVAARSASASEDLPLSRSQQRLWFLAQVDPENPVYNIVVALRLSGQLNRDALDASLHALVQRHESLRTSFYERNGKPFARVVDAANWAPAFLDLSSLSGEKAQVRARELALEDARKAFRLDSAPLFRSTLFRISEQNHLLLLVVHHIVADGWSLGILARELTEIYSSEISRRPPALDDLVLQYRDFVLWEQNAGEQAAAAQMPFWLERLRGPLPILEIAGDRRRPAIQTFRGRRIAVRIAAPLAEQVRSACRSTGTTPFMLLLAAFKGLLSRYTGLDDILVGSGTSNRQRQEFAPLIGFFVNNLVLRTSLRGDPTFGELLARVQETATSAYAHQDVPFDLLVEKVAPKRELSYSPLVQMMFTFQNVPMKGIQLQGLGVNYEELDPGIARADLSVEVWPEGEEYRCDFEYNTDVFEESAIRAIQSHYLNFLRHAVADLSVHVRSIALLSIEERRKVLVEWNETSSDYPALPVHEVFEAYAKAAPHGVALRGSWGRLTYGDLDRTANAIAHSLCALKLPPHSFVAVCAPGSPLGIAAFLGVLKAGHAYIPVDAEESIERTKGMLTDADVKALLFTKNHQDHFSEIAILHCAALEGLAENPADQAPDVRTEANDPAYLMFPSGSTGRPKGVVVPHRGIVRLVKGTDSFSLTGDDVLLQAAPLTFDGSTFEIWGALLNGACLVLTEPERRGPEEIALAISEHGVTTLWLTAALFHFMVTKHLDALRPLRQLVAGGDVLSPVHVERVVKELPHLRLINGYGSTENTVFTCCHTIKADSLDGGAIPIGRPIRNTRVYLLDENFQPVPCGVSGELFAAGDGLALSYLNSPALTAERFVNLQFEETGEERAYRTGDLARYRSNGVIEFIGRRDKQIKLRGEHNELARKFEAATALSSNAVAASDPKPFALTAEHPLSRSQWRLWFLDQMDPANPVYNIGVALRINGPLDRDALGQSLKLLVDRHESLRTRFLQSGESAYALVERADDWQMDFLEIAIPPRESDLTPVLEFAQAESQRPFFLDRGPLFRATLVKAGPEQHVLVLVMHHIISDGWSLGVLARELCAMYASISSGRPSALPPLQVQFRDFVAWERKEAESAYAADIRYWRKQLAGELAPLDLPTDYPRPSVQGFRGRKITAEISSNLVERLQKASREQNGTLFMILFAAFTLLLRNYSRQEDILVGTPTAGRAKSEFEALVGFFVNNLVLRTDLRGNPSFGELMQRVQKTALEAFEHQSVPFDQLVEELQPERSLDRSPIFQVLFALQNIPIPSLRLGDMEMVPLDFQNLRARYDLAVDVYPFQGNYRCEFEFNTDLFEESTVGRMQQHYLRLLEEVASDPNRPLSALSLLSSDEKHQLIEEWNRTEFPGDPYPTVPAWFQAQAARTPDATAVIAGDEALSYAELDAQSSALAAVLRARGIGRESVVGIYLQRSPGMVVAMLGILKAGAAYLPLDPALPASRVEFLLADAEVPLILTQTEFREVLSSSDVPLLMIDSLHATVAGGHDDQSSWESCGPEDLAYLIYTSGSTGNPKGTEITHKALVNLLASMLREPGLSAGDTLVAVTTLSFDIAGLEILGPLVCGAKLVLASREQVLDPGLLAALLQDANATVMQATPSTWRMLIEDGWMGKADLRMWCGGEALSADLADNLLVRGRQLWNLYGPTETTIWSAAHRVKSGENPILIGRPIGNTRMYILDPDGQPVPVGVPGELYIGGDGVARGYWRSPELTESRFLSDPFDLRPGRRMYRTGDLARYRSDGRIQLIGRTDHQIKLRGHRIELGEIESVIEKHPGVLQAVVSLYGEGSARHLVAYLRHADGVSGGGQLRSWLQERLPEYMVPSAFVALDEIPLTPNGKVDRKRLPKPVESTRQSLPAVDPRNDIEERLVRIWSEVLGVHQVSVTDNFFDLGGHSLLLVRVHARARQELDSELAVIDLFRYPTIESLAACLERRRMESTLPAGVNA